MICVLVLQNCMGFVEGATGSYSETCVKYDVDRTEEVSIKVEEAIDIKDEIEEAIDIKDEIEEAIDIKDEMEEAIDIKDEIPEAVTLSSIKTEHGVRLWDVCELVAAHAS